MQRYGFKTRPANQMSRPLRICRSGRYTNRVSATASEFFETDDRGGVVLFDGRRLTADVMMTDGVGTKSWALVVGNKEPLISSWAIMFSRVHV
ncbi:uncharacterized protein N7469_005866 [Penicillium citrinum]|uniref:Uncharacterized protein n=1 Tax=Penicillium citrinum TaxID=5077 RepID=A0A9W9TM47_PENCI|nr:uncharacterized protein N7469_005866 [Penicillium citrinum]KAJ5231278.1 hypothetical protein N7469_005866 [Penicillium citrinum]